MTARRFGDDVLLPSEPIHRLTTPLEAFLHVEAAGGIVLLACTAVALTLANSPWADRYLAFWQTELHMGFGAAVLSHSLQEWINDALMAVFFFVIGLEVKRELVIGELRDPRRAALPLAGAIGGMLVPAAIYLALQGDGLARSGWGIPMATDIAFVVGCLALLGERVPHGLRVLLLSLAIADDLGAILVIAIGYSDSLDWRALGLGLAGFGLVFALGRLGVRSFLVYAVVGVGIWLAIHASGVHATLAGVGLGLLTPTRAYVKRGRFAQALQREVDALQAEEQTTIGERSARVRELLYAARETISPLEYLESLLHPWVGFVIMPLFALANAGVPVQLGGFSDPIALAVAAGLVVGKPVGVLLCCWLAVRSGVARMPDGVGWDVLAGAATLAGIGFTMSLFIAGLALEGPLLDAAKLGTLEASAIAAALGMAVLAWRLPREKALPPSAGSA